MATVLTELSGTQGWQNCGGRVLPEGLCGRIVAATWAPCPLPELGFAGFL